MLRQDNSLNLQPVHQGYHYQVDAVQAVKNLKFSALFHEQGLGKTKIAIDLSLHWLSENVLDTIIIVTKRSLVENWRQEFAMHTNLTPRILTQDRKLNFFVLNSAARIVLAHFEVIRSEKVRLELFLKTRRVGIILDESQKIKNLETSLTKSFHALRKGFERRVIMTGTPVANRPEDIWSQIYFLDGGKALGNDFDAFRSELDLSNDLYKDEGKQKKFAEGLSEVFGKIRPFTVRETKDSTGIDLPDKVVRTVSVNMEPIQRQMYTTYREEMRAEIIQDGQLKVDDAEAVLKRLLRLVQVTSNPKLVDDGYKGVPAKLPELLRIVRKALNDGSKIIVWSSFVANVDWLTKRLAEFGTVKVHGEMHMAARNAAISDFKSRSDVKILVATPGAAKEGLTLTVANHAVFYDRTFSLDDYLQSQDRIHRISQTRECYVWNIVCENSVDTWIDSLLQAKRLAAQLVQSDVSREEYEQKSNYDFGRIIAQILDTTGENT